MNQTKLWVFRGMMMLASLFAVNANAVNIPISTFTCTQSMTATSTCVNGFYASGWQTPGTGYWQYALNTTGYTGAITMTFNTTKSAAAGPTTGQIWYSINGGAFTLLPVGSGGTYAVSTSCATKVATLPSACAGVANLVVQMRMSGATANTATNRISATNVFDAASSACSSAPTAGTVTATPGVICNGFTSTLNLAGATAGSGISYQWQSSPNNSTWSNVSGATGLSYTTPALSSTTYYRAVVTCAGFGSANSTSDTVKVNTTAVAAITGYTAPLLVGATQTLADVTAGGVWSSSDPSVASIDLITGSMVGEFGGSSTISYSVTNGVTGCTGSSTINVNVVWPNTLALYAGVNGNSTSTINVPGDVVSTLYTTGFGANTPCGSGGISGLTVPVADTTFNTSNPHVGYKVYPTTGNALNMFRIHARARISGTGPTKARIAYQSWSNGIGSGWVSEAADVALVTGSCGASANSWDFNSGNPANPNPTVNGITDSLEVAVFPFAPGASTGTFQLNDLEVYGIVTTNADCNILPNAPDSVLPAIVNICDSGARFLNYNIGSGGLAGVNILYQWQRSTNGTTWSDISGADGVVYQTPNFHAGVDPDTNFYRVVVTCDASGDTTISTANVVTVNPTPANAGTISGALAVSGAFPMKHMLIGSTYPMTSSIAGGTWSSNDTSSISFGGTATATPNLPGDAIITYRVSVGGCFGTSKDTVAAYYPNTKALYIGKGGNSTAVYAASGATATALTTANWGSSTACGSGGISGLTNTTTVQDQTTNGRVSTTVAATGAPFTANSVRATLRKQNSGAYKAYLGYRTVGAGSFTIDPTPVDVETDDCGYSHNELVFPISTTVSPTGTEFAVFGYNGTATTTLQVNTMSILGTGTQLINGNTGLTIANNASDVQLFPNPATNVLNVTAAEKVNVVIMSVDGKKLIEQKDAKHINVSSLVSGMYLIQVYGENNNLLKAEKFIKK